MKKTFIFLILLVLLVGLSPFLGNKIVTYYVDEEIVALREKGITLNFKSETPGYLYTSKQYEFILNDVEAFAAYLTEYGAGLLPPYTDEFLKSIVFRLDMRYSNIPFSEPISIDIYPMYISDKMMDKLHSSNNIFFKNFRQFISRQGLLYHIDYDLLSENYKGHIKNIDYDERGYDGSNVILTLHNAVFNGTGSFRAPESLKSDIDKIMLKTSDTSKDVTLKIDKFSSRSSKDVTEVAKDLYDKSKIEDRMNDVREETENAARDMYNTSMKMQSMFFNTRDKSSGEETTLEAKDAEIDVSSEKEDEKSKNRSYFFFEKLNFRDDAIDLNMTQVTYDSSMSELNTVSYEQFQDLLAKAKLNPSVSMMQDIKVSGINLLSHGLKLEIPELSVANVHYEGEDLGGLKLMTALNVKEDKNLAAKMLFSPLFIVQNVDFKLHVTVSKKIYKKFVEVVPFALVTLAATKQTQTDLIYDISFIDGDLKVNGNSVL